ncbi:MAG: hypothetical protein HY046_04490 [Acidobacteria bacterium]|nr:hypothetical protein [Acidobacteriota bacterium]
MKKSKQPLSRYVRAFRGRRIGVVGDLMLDRYLYGTATRLSPESVVPVVDLTDEIPCPGGAGNVGANLAALGAAVSVFGVVGGDEFGQPLQETLKNAGLSTKGVVVDPSRRTTVKTRIIARHQQVVRLDRETKAPLDEATREHLLRRVMSGIRGLHALVISDYDKGVIGDELIERILQACHRLKIAVIVQPKKLRLTATRGAAAIVCNRSEAAQFIQQPLDNDSALEEAGKLLLARFGCAAMVITLGDKGMCVFEDTKAKSFQIPATGFEVTYARVGLPGVEHGATGRQVFDVTGAGDTVVSVLALAIAAGASMRNAATIANCAAGIVVGKLGTACVSPQELIGALHETK